MPKFRVETPNGTYEVDAPEGTTEDQIKAEIEKTQAADARPEINNLAEGARTFAKGATFGFADEIEAKVRTGQSLKDQTSRSDQYKASYEEMRQLQADRLAGRTSPEAQARSQELSGMMTGENNQLAQEQDARYKSVRDDLRASNAEFAKQNPKLAMGLELAGGITTPVLGAAKAATLGGKIARGSLQGAGFGAAYGAGNADEMEDVGRDTLLQGAAGGAMGGVLSGVGAVLAPKLQQGAKAFSDKGIPITPGQAFGGLTDWVEQKVGAVMPGINKSRNRSVQKWNNSLIDDVLEPLGVKAGNLGDDLLANVHAGKQVLSKSYDDVLPFIGIKDKVGLTKAINSVRKDQILSDSAEKTLTKEMSKIQGFLSGKNISGESVKDIQTHLGKRIQAYAGTTNADDKAIGNALSETLDTLMTQVQKQNPKYSDKLKAVNTAYAKFIRIQNAASKLTDGETFTPKQFASAVRQSDRSKGKNAVAAGKALMQGESRQAKILGNKLADSGTAGNLILNGGLLASVGSNLINPMYMALPAASYGIYSKPGMAAFNAWVKTGKGNAEALRKIIEKYSGTASSGLLTLQD